MPIQTLFTYLPYCHMYILKN